MRTQKSIVHTCTYRFAVRCRHPTLQLFRHFRTVSCAAPKSNKSCIFTSSPALTSASFPCASHDAGAVPGDGFAVPPGTEGATSSKGTIPVSLSAEGNQGGQGGVSVQ